MTKFKLYRAGLLNNQRSNIIRDIEAYLSTCQTVTVNVNDVELYDDITVTFDKSALTPYAMTYPTYAKATTASGNIAYYYVTNIQDVTPHSISMVLSRDYVNPIFYRYARIHGQLVEGHLPLVTNDRHYSVPVGHGDALTIKRSRAITRDGLGEWGAFGKVAFVFRVVLSSDLDLVDSKVVLIRTSPYGYLSREMFTKAYNLVSSATKLRFIEETEQPQPFQIDIEEVTNAWIVPEGFAPTIFEGWNVYATTFQGDNDNAYKLGVPTSDFDIGVYEIPTYTNVRSFIGNSLTHIELPYSTNPHIVTAVSYYGIDSMLSFTLRWGDVVLDMTSSMDIGSNLFSNSSATLSGKISRGIGVMTGVLGTATGVVTGNPLAIAGGVISIGSSIGSGIGGRTAVNSSGADGLQSIYTGSIQGSDYGYAARTLGPLNLIYYETTTTPNIHGTINLFGVQTNTAYSGYLQELLGNNYMYVKFDNVRVEGSGYPPQYVQQLSDMLTRGVHIWNEGFDADDGYPLFTWSGDFHEL